MLFENYAKTQTSQVSSAKGYLVSQVDSHLVFFVGSCEQIPDQYYDVRGQLEGSVWYVPIN